MTERPLTRPSPDNTQPVPAPTRPRSVIVHVMARMVPAWAALALVLLALLSVLLLLRSHALNLQRASSNLNATERLRADVLDMETGLRGYALTGSPEFLQPYDHVIGTLGPHLQAFREAAQATGMTRVNRAATEAEVLIVQWRQTYAGPVLTRGPGARRDLELARLGKRLVDDIRVQLDVVEEAGHAQVNGIQDQIAGLAGRWLPLLTLLSLLSLALNLWVLLRLATEIRDGLRHVTQPDALPAWLRWQESVEARASVDTRVSAVQGELAREREERRRTGLTLDGVLNTMTSQLWVLDEHGSVTRINRAGLQALHLHDQHLQGTRLQDLWPELAQLYLHGDTLPDEPQELPTPDGPRWFLLQRDEQERGTLLLLTDVTPLQLSRHALEASNVNLTRSNTDLEHYAFVASHDLQEPLRTIGSFAGLLLATQGDRLDERGQFYARNVIEGAERLKRLIQDLLSFAKVRAEQLEFAPVDMTHVTHAVLATLEEEVGRCAAHVTVAPLPPVLGRESLITQLLFNLMQNALKFCRDDLTLHLNVHAEPQGDFVRFTVEDNGIGIAPEYQEQVFVIFQRLHGRARYQGNGLGLAICRRIVELHGGRIWLESQEGMGCRFHFTLPAARLDGSPEDSAPLDRPRPGTP